jgi:hypothetical protein
MGPGFVAIFRRSRARPGTSTTGGAIIREALVKLLEVKIRSRYYEGRIR